MAPAGFGQIAGPLIRTLLAHQTCLLPPRMGPAQPPGGSRALPQQFLLCVSVRFRAPGSEPQGVPARVCETDGQATGGTAALGADQVRVSVQEDVATEGVDFGVIMIIGLISDQCPGPRGLSKCQPFLHFT